MAGQARPVNAQPATEIAQLRPQQLSQTSGGLVVHHLHHLRQAEQPGLRSNQLDLERLLLVEHDHRKGSLWVEQRLVDQLLGLVCPEGSGVRRQRLACDKARPLLDYLPGQDEAAGRENTKATAGVRSGPPLRGFVQRHSSAAAAPLNENSRTPSRSCCLLKFLVR
jgi:hypothetical protein